MSRPVSPGRVITGLPDRTILRAGTRQTASELRHMKWNRLIPLATSPAATGSRTESP
jgi:hypothetical protein